jgi:putative transposase
MLTIPRAPEQTSALLQSPTERVRAQIDELFDSGRELGHILEEVARRGVALLFQAAFEAEITEFLGRERYARGERSHQGLRNGYSPVTVKTSSGPVTLERPKLRGNDEPFVSRLLRLGVTRTKALESLVIASFVRGLSVRDVEATLAEALGEQAALSKSTVSRICQVLVSQFEVWQKRGLEEYELDYLFADASFFKYHPAAKGEPILCTHGITTEGKKVFMGLTAGAAESYESWHAHFTDLRTRGLRPPLLGITDGRPRPGLRLRASLLREPPPEVCGPRRPQCAREGQQARSGGSQEGLLGDPQ